MNISFGLFTRVANKFNFLYKNNSLLRNLSSQHLLKPSLNYSPCAITKKFSQLESTQLCQNGLNNQFIKNFSIANFSHLSVGESPLFTKPLAALGPKNLAPSRSLIKWSLNKGKKRSEMDVVKRFKRLNWGIWIRPKAGAYNRLWRKKKKSVNRIQQNVFCSAHQSRKLDIMVTSYWRKPRVFADDPYEPYQTRESFSLTRKSPQEYPSK